VAGTSCWAALGSIYKKLQEITQAEFAFSQAAAGLKIREDANSTRHFFIKGNAPNANA
jgi:Flp pilus assembly protein TadD